MTRFNSTHKFTVAAAFGAAALFSMLSFGSNADAAKSLSMCVGNTAAKVVNCCKEMTEAGRPLWMVESNTSCRQATVCRSANIAAAVAKPCYIQVMHIEGDGGNAGNRGRRGGNQLK
jgi:hypothetical protein